MRHYQAGHIRVLEVSEMVDLAINGYEFRTWGPNEVIVGLGAPERQTAASLRSVAAPLRDHPGAVVAAIVVATPTARVSLEELLTTLLPPLTQTASQISGLAALRADGRLANA